MLSRNKALVGKRVYGGASQSPNRGQVSAAGAQGYIQRELRNKAAVANKRQRGFAVANPRGRDGMSDNRSGVAAQALGRRVMHGGGNAGKQPFQNGGPVAQNGGRPVVGGKGTKAGMAGNHPQAHNGGRPIVGGKGTKAGMAGNQPQSQNGGRPVVDANGQPVGSGPKTPQVKVNEAGLLELPYDNDFAMEQYNALNEANQQLLGLKAEGDQQGLEYQQARREADLNYGQTQRQTLNSNAARGTAFSSAYGTAAAGNANQYANQVGGLDAQNTAFQNNQAMQRAAIQSALNQQLQLATLGYGNSLAENAGSLGFGNSELTVRQLGSKPNQPKGGKKRPRRSKATNKRSKAAGAALRKQRKGN